MGARADKKMIVFIPAAGMGDRVSHLGPSKPLISIGSKPLIWRIFDLYPDGTHFVVAVGHRGDQLKETIEAYRHTHQITCDYVETNSHNSGTRGLTQTMLDAKTLLQRPFIFHSCDTYVGDKSTLFQKLLETPRDSIVSAPTLAAGAFRIFEGGGFTRRTVAEGTQVYIGLAAVRNWIEFWSEFDLRFTSDFEESGETLGLVALDSEHISLAKSDWIDAGSEFGITKLREKFKSQDAVLPKKEEAIWATNGWMYKYHDSADFIRGRVERAEVLSGFVPPAVQLSPHFLTYKRVDGNVLSICSELSCFTKFLAFSKDFWFRSDYQGDFSEFNFEGFYSQKTRSRINLFLESTEQFRLPRYVNAVDISNFESALDSAITLVEKGVHVGLCHGDLHPENVLHNHLDDSFVLLDWRQDFADSTSGFGDIYYDLGKILHGLIVDHHTVLSGNYSFISIDNEIRIRIQSPGLKRQWLEEFLEWVETHDFNVGLTWTHAALIFLNIAALHHRPYGDFLFYLGIAMLYVDQDKLSASKCIQVLSDMELFD